MNDKTLQLSISLITLKDIRDKCEDKVLKDCLLESVHKNNIVLDLYYFCLYKLEEVDRLTSLLLAKDLNTYIVVLEQLTNKLINIFH